MASLRALAALVVALLLVSGCRLDVVASTELAQDGTGTLTLAFRMDDELLTELDALGIDPTIEVTALASELEGWQLERTVDEQAAITIELTREFQDPAEVGEVLRALASGLASDDPALLLDLDLDVADDGSARVDGVVAFRPPATVGAQLDGEMLGPSRDELATMTEQVVVPRLEVTLPGPTERTDADRTDGRTHVWDVPIDASRTISATSAPPGIHEQPWVWLVTAGVLVLLLGTWLVVRRR
jgi:hypothetical protein